MKPTKWEYKVSQVETDTDDRGYSLGLQEDWTEAELNKLGSEGWELVAVSGKWMFFKRMLVNR